MPFRVVYSSEAVPGLNLAKLETMLSESRIRNAARGITGVLVFVEGIFLQILEGERRAVRELMRSIERDKRHRHLKVFYEEETDGRAFGSWSMAYLSPSTEEVSQWAELDGGSTIESILLALEKDPDRFQRMVANLLRAIALPASG